MTKSRQVADFGAGGFTAGKNAVINGDFRINQRVFTSNTTDSSFNFDRWFQSNSGGTTTTTPQVFTPGTAPVVGYEGVNFQRTITASQSAAGDFAYQRQKIEDVRTFANQTVTVSFWAKAATGTPKIALELAQIFGSGGSSAVTAAVTGTATLSTSWARYSITGTVPSLSGKTIGTSSELSAIFWVSAGATYAARASSIGIQNNTFDIWGVQLEAGSVATPFTTATGTIQGELAACQRYFRIVSSAPGVGSSATQIQSSISHPGMRTTPSVALTAVATFTDCAVADYTQSSATMTISNNDADGGRYQNSNFTGITSLRAYILLSSGGKVQLSAEL